MDFISTSFEAIKGNIMAFSMKVVVCILLLFIGLKLINIICNKVNKIMVKSKVEPTLNQFLCSIFKIVLKILLVLSILSTLDVKVISFVAILGAASFAIGMALQGSLANFAAGVIIIILKPFKVGDFVQISGLSGTVSSIQIFSTILKTPDNLTIILPNGPIISSNIINYSIEENRRVDFVFGVDYSTDLKFAKKIITEVVENHKLVLKDPGVFVAVGELADSSVNFTVRVWVKSEDYWTVHFEIIEAMKLKLDTENIGIPYPHIQIIKN